MVILVGKEVQANCNEPRFSLCILMEYLSLTVHSDSETDLIKSATGSVVLFNIVSISRSSKKIISLTLIRASSFVRT